MVTSITVNRLGLILALAVCLAVAVLAGKEALAALAEGFGWGGAIPDQPAASLLAEGFGWGGPAPVGPGA